MCGLPRDQVCERGEMLGNQKRTFLVQRRCNAALRLHTVVAEHLNEIE